MSMRYNVAVKNKTKKFLTILLILAIVALIVLYRLSTLIHSAGSAARIAGQIHRVITSYIQENHGDFPANEVDLEQQLFIRKIKTDEGDEYFIRSASFDPQYPEDKKGWIKIWDFDLFKIFYGVNVEDIEMIDDKLYDKATKEQILLIDGSYKKNLQRNHYEPISVKWYNQMLQEKQKDGSLKDATTLPTL